MIPGREFGPFSYKIAIGFLILCLLALTGIGSLHLYDYTEHDPKFCISCHIMEDAFESWETSIHKGVECHDCHYATIWEKNYMLLKTVLTDPKEVSERPHEKIIVPSSMCIGCHWKGEMKVANISESTGHAMHWFKGGMECTSCHAKQLHKFGPEQRLCINCHENGKLLLAGMKEMSCTDCHNFRQGKLVPGEGACLGCHEKLFPVKPGPEVSKAHKPFTCMTCHKNHSPGKPAAMGCPDCHKLDMKKGKHPIHLGALNNDCISCHLPHKWKITKAGARDLCSQCHKNYPLKKFRS